MKHKRTIRRNSPITIVVNKPGYKPKVYDGNMGSEDKDIHLELEKNKYLVKFITNSPQKLDSIEVEYNEQINLPTLSRSGKTFKGWYFESSFINKADSIITIYGNKKLYAKWE